MEVFNGKYKNVSEVDFRSQQLPRILATARVRPSSLCHAAQARLLLDDESLDDSLGASLDGSLCGSLGWTMIASAKALQPASLLITATIPQEKPLPGRLASKCSNLRSQSGPGPPCWLLVPTQANSRHQGTKACLKLLNDFSIGPWPWPFK